MTTEADDYDSFDEQNCDRPMERWAPLGAAASSPSPSVEENSVSVIEQLRHMEEEQEMLNSSLLSLTTHFAQVQFRLKQIVSAPADDKEGLLKELEEFAFRGIPDVRSAALSHNESAEELSEKEHESKLNEQREKQKELINQLKSQLEDLELYAYETGDAGLPTSKVMEKQVVIIDQLKQKIGLEFENFDKLNKEQLQQVVDHAIGQIVNPVKVKEKMVEQLKTQIVDLERFIQFLQGEATTPGPMGDDHCTCPTHPSHTPAIHKSSSPTSRSSDQQKFDQQTNDTTVTAMRKVLALLQIFAVTQFGCGSKDFKRNVLKRTPQGNHWGDLRAKLELAVDKVLLLAKQEVSAPLESDYTSDSDDSNVVQCNPELTQAVRKELAVALRDLMQHGLIETGQSSSVVRLGCLPNRSSHHAMHSMHAWDLLMKYYLLKHGDEYNESPARKLSQSFHLNIVGGQPITAKQTLLGAMGSIVTTHGPLKRSDDSQFKAFICVALNERRLVNWLRLVYRTQSLVDYHYQDWSYAARTGFEDAFHCLERLNMTTFHLPVNLAIRQFSNIRDAF